MLGVYNCARCHRPMLTKGLCRKCCEKMEKRDEGTMAPDVVEELKEALKTLDELDAPHEGVKCGVIETAIGNAIQFIERIPAPESP